MEIVVGVKPVPDAETRLRARPDRTGLDEEDVKWVLAGYDESAVEQALLLKEAGAAASVRVISAGPAPRTEEALRAAIALGCDKATWVETPAGTPLDALGVARVLATAIGRLPHDLVLVGKQSGDEEAGLLGPALAAYLDVPDFPAVVDLRWDTGRSTFAFQSSVEGGAFKVEATAPLVLTLQQAWNDPRTAKLPNILKSRKAPIERVAWTDASGALGDRALRHARPTLFRLPAPRTGAKLIAYKSPDEAAETLIRLLREESKVFP
ncbi:MAG TPA: electron transfer flavoprotein subunit beta/FixA family protein [Thermoplasmata archaeon]|nr:electron transfer flavoprotein subunit beta/FixA family protein [Thermoplasmata archaeon]